jgi:hypothetical protein
MRNLGVIQTGPEADGQSAAYSRDQLSAVWSPDGNIFAAWPASPDGVHNWEIETERFISDFNLSQAINMRRVGQPGGVALSRGTFFLTTVPEFSERTRILALDGERLALDEPDLVKWLIAAEQQVAIGTDDHPIFETPLDDTACTIRRLPNGQVAMTEVPRAHIMSARDRVASILGERYAAQLNITVETPVRTVARYFLTAVKEGEYVQHAGKEAEVTAFVVIAKAGFRFGLYSPSTGLFSEYGFLAPKDVAQLSVAPPMGARPSQQQEGDRARLEAYVRQAFDQLTLQLSKEKLEQLQLSGYAQVVWASEPDLADTIAPIAAEHAGQIGIEVFHLDAPVAEASAAGLLLGSFAFGDTTIVGAAVLPQVNMARDLLVLADTEQDERRYTEAMFARKRRNQAIFSLVAAPIAVAGVLLAVVTGLLFSWVYNGIREARADQHTQELKPALDRRMSYEANLKWYQEFIKQVSRLRRQQPVGIGLLYQLNSNYPFAVDQAFYVSDMKLQPTGDIEMKGYARSKDAVASFLKALEFAGGPESGTRLFSNLAYEVQEGAPQQVLPAAGQQTLPTMSGSLLPNRQAKPGVIVWSIKGTYLPMVEFAPPPPAKPGAPPAAPAASPTPAR